MSVNSQLLLALDEIITAADNPLKEHEIISLLQKAPYFIFEPKVLSEPLRLFQCHFVVFHHLYLLQAQYMQQKQGYLTIHTTEIGLLPAEGSQQSLDIEDKVRQYYLDWSNFEKTDEAQVEALLDDFWRRMGNPNTPSEQDRKKALEILSLNDDFTQEQLKKHYRKLQHQFHPDKKSGNARLSQDIDWAYRALKNSMRVHS